MSRLRRRSLLTGVLALSSAYSAPGWTAQPAPAQDQAASTAAPAPQGPPKICLDAQGGDRLTKEFADRLSETIATSGTLRLGSTTGSCDLQLHVPGNLLRFETAGGVMVSTVVIVTSPSGQYLSSSITACQAGDLKPCALRAVGVAKLALLERSNGGT